MSCGVGPGGTCCAEIPARESVETELPVLLEYCVPHLPRDFLVPWVTVMPGVVGPIGRLVRSSLVCMRGKSGSTIPSAFKVARDRYVWLTLSAT